MSDAPPSTSSSTRRYLLLFAKIGVSVGLLWVLFSRIDVGRLWASARQASPVWLAVAIGVYALNVMASVWRWRLLLEAQDVELPSSFLCGSLLVSLFFNNFLPSNIGGDVIRIRDTAKPARSKTLATAVILMDRVLGLLGLVLVAAFAATVTGTNHRAGMQMWPVWLWAGFLAGAAASAPALLAPSGFGRMLQPLTVLHPEWVGNRIDTITSVLSRFRTRPLTLASCFGAAVFVQTSMVVFFFFVAYALHLNLTFWDLAVIVPLSFIVQMLPLSVNGFGVREATYAFYFKSIGQPIESAVLMSLVGTVLVMLFSLSGAAVWFARGHH
jgi:uncharacterized membrane protein YbhN (UPF0104 family)